jgi:phage tail sheath protein FI
VQSARGFAALYYPWVTILDPQSTTGDLLLIPPSGSIAGVYARVDQQRGVHKAPANEIVTTAAGLERVLSEADMGQLNIAAINVIRVFPNRTRPTVWGARTTTDPDQVPWRYVSVRRLFCYVETSIKLNLGWAIFEPNDLGLWQKIIRTISEFLTRVWKSGALFGATAEQAFYVKCDAELNPPSVRALGQVFVEIGMAPVRPAEFVIIRIGIWDDGSEVTE